MFFENTQEREENVAEHHHAWTITESQSADRHLATALEGSSVGNCGKEPQSDWWEKGGFQKSVSCSGVFGFGVQTHPRHPESLTKSNRTAN